MRQGEDNRLSTMCSKEERDLQGEGGGGIDDGGGAYTNPALSSSVNSVTHDSQLAGSNAFMLVDDDKSGSVFRSAGEWAKRRARGAFTKKMLFKRLPPLQWIPKYDFSCFVGDLLAGITVGLTVIPQSLAYAGIAGLSAEYGLYGSFLGCFVYIVLGSCKDVPMGPTAIASLLTNQAVNGLGHVHATLLCFLSGVVEVLMGIFGLGFLIDFVSGPVSSGFTSAVALIIVTSQVKDVLAIPVSGDTFLDKWISIFENIGSTKLWDTVLGVICIVVLLLMRLLAMVKFGPKEVRNDKEQIVQGPSTCQKVWTNVFWLIGTSRNAIVVVVTGFVGYAFYDGSAAPFELIGDIPPGMPEFQAPQFSYTDSETGIYYSFTDMVQNLTPGIIVVPMIALLESIAICKAFSNGNRIDATQELLAIGVSNIANSFVQAFPGTGSLSRSAVINSSGVKTPMAGLYTGVLVILALLYFTPYFYYIPKSALAAIIIAAVVFMVEVKVIKPMWRTKKSDLIPGLVTFIGCLVLALQIGIFIGIGVNLLFILYHAARPKIAVEKLVSRSGIEYLMLTPDRCLIFPSVDYVRNLVTKQSVRAGIPVVIDCCHIYGADYTAATVIETLTADFASRHQQLFFYNLKPSVCAIFEGLSPKEFIVYYNQDDIDRLLKEKTSYVPRDILNV